MIFSFYTLYELSRIKIGDLTTKTKIAILALLVVFGELKTRKSPTKLDKFPFFWALI